VKSLHLPTNQLIANEVVSELLALLVGSENGTFMVTNQLNAGITTQVMRNQECLQLFSKCPGGRRDHVKISLAENHW
jgi:hypothetical protein